MTNIKFFNILGSACNVFYTRPENGDAWIVASMRSNGGTIIDPLQPLTTKRRTGWTFQWHFKEKCPYTKKEIVKFWSDERKRLWDIETEFVENKWEQWVNMEDAKYACKEKLNPLLKPFGLKMECKNTESSSTWVRIVRETS